MANNQNFKVKNGLDVGGNISAANVSGTNTGDETKSSIDALGVDAATVNSLTVQTAVPAGAVFTDTTYSVFTTTTDGLVPQSTTSNTTDFLRRDGSWTTPPSTTPNDATITIAAGSGLTGGAAFTTDQAANETVTINVTSHAGTAGSIGTLDVQANTLGVSLGTTSTTAAPGNHTHSYDNYVSWNIKGDGATTYPITSGDTLNILGGTNVTVTASADDTLTIASTNTTYDNTDFVDLVSAQSIGGVKTFTAIPAFNGGASGSTAPFTVDSNTKVTNLNADLLDGASISTSTALGTSDTLLPTQNAVKAYVDANAGGDPWELVYDGSTQTLGHVPANDTNVWEYLLIVSQGSTAYGSQYSHSCSIMVSRAHYNLSQYSYGQGYVGFNSSYYGYYNGDAGEFKYGRGTTTAGLTTFYYIKQVYKRLVAPV